MVRSSLKTVIATSLMLAACGQKPVGAEDDYKAQEIRNEKARTERYSLVKGTYQGTVANPETGLEPLPATLYLYVVPKHDGSYPDGSPKMRSILYGRFQLRDAVTEFERLQLIGEYDELGALRMSSSSSSAQGSASGTGASPGGANGGASPGSNPGGETGLAIDGTILAEKAERLQVFRRGGPVWGYFTGTRVSHEATGAPAGDDVAYRDRLLQLYSKVEGSYIGTVKAVNGQPFPISLSLTITEGPRSQNGIGISIPVLTAYYQRLDFSNPVLAKVLAVALNSETGDIMMETIATGSTSVPGATYLSITGRVSELNSAVTGMQIRLRDIKQTIGDARMVKQ